MDRFNKTKNGYNPDEVERYITQMTKRYESRIADLKNENVASTTLINNLTSVVDGYKLQEQQIARALISAVSKAEEIEQNARNEALAQIENIRSIQAECEKLLNKMKESSASNNFAKSLSALRNSLDTLEGKLPKKDTYRKAMKENGNNYIRNVLNKMDYVVNAAPSDDVAETLETLDIKEHEKSNDRIKSIGGRLQSISQKVALGGTLAQRYLDSEIEDHNNAYFKNFAQAPKKAEPEYAFDLDSVLTPDENLEEIMSSFDFYDPEKKK